MCLDTNLVLYSQISSIYIYIYLLVRIRLLKKKGYKRQRGPLLLILGTKCEADATKNKAKKTSLKIQNTIPLSSAAC